MNTAVEPYKASSFDLTHKLTVEKHGHTALITINHPPANTWDRDSLIGLRQLIEHLNRDDDIYALVVTGQGPKFFSAGADLNMFADGDKARAREMARRFGEAFEALRDFRGVSIAAINGYAMGGGLGAPSPATSASPSARRRWPCRRPRWACCPAPAGPRRCPGWWAKAGPSG